MGIRAITRLAATVSVLAFFAAACGGDDPITATDDTSKADHDAMHGDVVEFEGNDVPTVELEVVADSAGGVNIGVSTTNYTITPRSTSTEHVEGEGHFDLYIDGEKALRFYNEWVYFGGLTEGNVEIMVELSANDHRAYARDGDRLYAMTTFSVPDHTHDAHSHDEPIEAEFAGPAPTLSVEVLPDPKSGYNAFIEVDGIVLSGEHASQEPVDGEGHLNIYVNGQKIGRLYGGATHIRALPEGDLEITVAAYSNDHQPYVVDGQPVEAQTTITVG